jgi:protoheme IX farnesyltransferase
MRDVSTITPETIPSANWRAVVSAYISLMKPHVTVLLLGVTLAAMVVASPSGLPALGLIVATLVGGALAAGSANAINCYCDRDIDQVMTRSQ